MFYMCVQFISGALFLAPPLPGTSANGFQERCPNYQSAWNSGDPLTNGWKDISSHAVFKEGCI